MSVADDIVKGLLCMQCMTPLIDENGEFNKADCPCLCYDCWKSLPKSERRDMHYFDERSGDLCHGVKS